MLINVYKSDFQKRKTKIGKKGLDVALTSYHGGNESSDEKGKKKKEARGVLQRLNVP